MLLQHENHSNDLQMNRYGAAIAAAFCFGSFGVPVKSKVASKLDIDPLVMQVCVCVVPFTILSTQFLCIYLVHNAYSSSQYSHISSAQHNVHLHRATNQ